MIKLRLNNIEFREYSDHKKFEIVKWYPNKYYGKELEYKWNGDFAYMPNSMGKIHKSCFNNPENCYVISFIDFNITEPNIEVVGFRDIQLDEDSYLDYRTVANMGIEMFYKQHNIDDNNDS